MSHCTSKRCLLPNRCPSVVLPSAILETRQNTFCTSCFDEVCARCANAGDGVPDGAQVQIDGIPLCAEPPSGVAALSRGATLATLSLKKGYYRTSNHSHEVRQCYHEDACLGGNDADKYCASGYEGPCENETADRSHTELFTNIGIATELHS